MAGQERALRLITLRRHALPVVLAVAACVLLASLAVSQAPAARSAHETVYESTASIVYVRESERVLVKALGSEMGRAIDLTSIYAPQIASPEFMSAVAAEVGTGIGPADVSRTVRLSTSPDGSVISIRVRWTDPRLAESIATAIARYFVDMQSTARMQWVSDYRDKLSMIDRRSLPIEPPDPVILLADPLYVADVSPATPADPEPRREAPWQTPWAITVLVLLFGAGTALAYERMARPVMSAEDLEKASGLRRLGPGAATSPENVAALAVDLARALRSADRNGVVITSPGRGDGKTTIAIDLATFFGASGLKAIVVESDFLGGAVDGPRQAGPGRAGLANLLASDVPIGPDSIEPLIAATAARGVSLVPRGAQCRGARARLGSARMKAVVKELGKRADIVLYDSPAAPAVHDAATLASMAGTSLLIVREGWTSTTATRIAIDQLSMAGAPILGFADVRQPSLLSIAKQHASQLAHAMQDARRVPLKRAVPAIAHIMLPLLPGR